jgi:hypothetical protein
MAQVELCDGCYRIVRNITQQERDAQRGKAFCTVCKKYDAAMKEVVGKAVKRAPGEIKIVLDAVVSDAEKELARLADAKRTELYGE